MFGDPRPVWIAVQPNPQPALGSYLGRNKVLIRIGGNKLGLDPLSGSEPERHPVIPMAVDMQAAELASAGEAEAGRTVGKKLLGLWQPCKKLAGDIGQQSFAHASGSPSIHSASTASAARRIAASTGGIFAATVERTTSAAPIRP